ncbi:MAG: sigma-70 family RNA polymerase sigma factor [Gemmatimonadales bacterium]|nr:sigma-70 family RNA polymerase sigma factor [Gemmatimonadales bacterium]NIN49406.1 sigma-70 family RNA polymerase sigma factor [Gemmatimonadales bacterium]NIP06870.1 sigma-70 family RNA polymerase sigma factor [Gemmatimonadales bacterium]NIS65506.1 sigma-70 family RNA polymerase sigma factor [Gemmatimonadales bacterium]
MQDAELAALAQAGDREAFGELVSRYAGQARRVARAILHSADDADDAAQDGFLAALRHLGRYDPARPFGPWLIRIVANAASDRRRRLKVRRTEAIPPSLPAREPAPDTDTDRRSFREALLQALATLPERQRIAVVLFDVEGYSHREVAAILKVPEGTARSDVFHARRALRTQLAAWEGWKEETG